MSEPTETAATLQSEENTDSTVNTESGEPEKELTPEEKEEQKITITQLDSKEIKKLARRIILKEIFCTNDPEAIRCAFMVPLVFCLPKLQNPEDIGAVWGTMSGALSNRSINGYPCLFDVAFVHKDNMPLLIAEIKALEIALGLKEEEVQPEPTTEQAQQPLNLGETKST